MKPATQPTWSEIPCAEGWWFDPEFNEWMEVSSTDLSTAIVDITWRGLWYGPIIIPEQPAQAAITP
jgi:hypothetical protein